MPIRVGTNTEDIIKEGLCHFTKSRVLEDILCDNYISMMATCIKNYWKSEKNAYDDNQEFKGLLELQKVLSLDLPRNEKKNENLRCADIVNFIINRVEPKPKKSISPKKSLLPIIVSTTTPYIMCFGYNDMDEHMFHKFCNPQLGYPVMLKFNTEKILNNEVLWRFHNETSFYHSNDKAEDPELMQVYYTHSKESFITDDAAEKVKKALEELNGLRGNVTSDDNNKLDSFFYVKRGRYEDEQEIRYILRIKEPSAFGLTEDGQLIFTTDKMYGDMSTSQIIRCHKCKRRYEGENNDANIFIKFSPKCLEKIIVGPCAPSNEINKIKRLLNNREGFNHVEVISFKQYKKSQNQ